MSTQNKSQKRAKAKKLSKDHLKCNKPKKTPSHKTKSHVVKACKDGTDFAYSVSEDLDIELGHRPFIKVSVGMPGEVTWERAEELAIPKFRPQKS